ncbi:SH3 domain-containing protein [Leptolyngbyaceae cyanobacterium JSC-12]|nr:SH3 domain-containing protein [Leptolyngbyaceae cyanobacterium JSC-12]
MSWSGFFKGFSAVLIAIVLLLGGSFFAFQFVVSQFTAPPPRPTFPNDTPSPAAKPAAAIKPSAAASPAVPSPSPVASPTPSPSPKPAATAAKRARITLGEGLNIRQGPSADTERVGGVDYSDEVTILEESPDKEWVKVRVESSGAEGWIKSGYTEPVPQESVQ